MDITWHGKPGWKNKGHEIDYGTAPSPHVPGWSDRDTYYFSLCGHRHDDPHFRLWVYCSKGWKHLGPSGDDGGFESPEQAREFAATWIDDTVAAPPTPAEIAGE